MASVIRSFRNRATEDLFNGVASGQARRALAIELWPIAKRKLDQLNRVREPFELAAPPGNNLERLAGDRQGQHSIRINRQYRICFRWEEGHASEVEITDYH
jgi:toxin HigB-1